MEETFAFAFDCKSGGTHAPPSEIMSHEAETFIAKLDKEKTYVKLVMEALGLDHVADTFVGNADVRGVSGGQRRRVTLGEQIQISSPILVGDEISTGLDAASTYDICSTIMHFTKLQRTTRVLSLLQPSPETVSLFDEVILLAEGRILFAGPISKVEEYFGHLGYRAPDQMDVADFLQVLSTGDGAKLFDNAACDALIRRESPYTITELADAFEGSVFYQRIIDSQTKHSEDSWVDKSDHADRYRKKYRTSLWRQTTLNIGRNITIWRRDKRFLIANAVKNVIMGISVGGVFFSNNINHWNFWGMLPSDVIYHARSHGVRSSSC